jgi:hypothetical protein
VPAVNDVVGVWLVDVMPVTVLRLPELNPEEVSIWNVYDAIPLSESLAVLHVNVGFVFVVEDPLEGEESDGVLGAVWSTPNWFDQDQSDSNPPSSNATAATHTEASLLLEPPQSQTILQPPALFVSSPIM